LGNSPKTATMKKIMMLVMLTLAGFFLSEAGAQFTPGIKGGLSFARLTGFDGNTRTTGHAGIFLHHTINNRWCVQPEILYSGEGQHYFSEDEERTIALGYISVPVMVQYYPTRQLYFEFGPQLGFLVSAEDKGMGNDIVNVKSDFTKTQVSFNVGAGITATNRLGFYGRYNFGLTDVSLFDNIVDHSQVGQLGITYRLEHHSR
jgi:hypothetical protein